jgi:hypothetical protein
MEYKESPISTLILWGSIFLAFGRRSLKPLGYGFGLFLLMKWIQYDDKKIAISRMDPSKRRVYSTRTPDELLSMYKPNNTIQTATTPAQPVPIYSPAIPTPLIDKTETTVVPSVQGDKPLLGSLPTQRGKSAYYAPVAPAMDPFDTRKHRPQLTEADKDKMLYSVREQQNIRGSVQASFQDRIDQTNKKPASINPAFNDIFGAGNAVGSAKFVSRPSSNF